MKFDLIKIGYISKSYAFSGDIKCTLEVNMLSEKFVPYIWMYLDGKAVPFYVEKASLNKQSFIIKLEDISSEEEAMRYKNTSIYCEKKNFDTYFETIASLNDLVGYTVIDEIKGDIGKVIGVLENAIQPTLVILFNEKEILIPYSEDIVKGIDDTTKTISIVAPEGLIDLYLE